MDKKRDRRCRLTISQEKAVAKAYASGKWTGVIAKEYGISKWLVHAIAKRAGLIMYGRGNRVKHFSKRELNDMSKLYHAGKSQETIAKIYNTSQIKVSRVLRQHNLIPDRLGARRERSNFWKGGKITTTQGYVFVMVDEKDPMACMRNRSGYILEHRLVMARKLGRPLTAIETIHHINGDRSDNRIENLQLCQRDHGDGLSYQCADCGSYHVVPVAMKQSERKQKYSR